MRLPPLLAVDTAHRRFSVALAWEGKVFDAVEREPFRHVERLNAKVEELLERAGASLCDLKGILITIGPGFFTSLRVSASFAKALNLACGIPIYGFNTLMLMAVGLPDGKYLVSMDARKGQLYAQTFSVEGGTPREDDTLPLGVYAPEDLKVLEERGYVPVGDPDGLLRASNLLILYQHLKPPPLPPNFSPMYVRSPDAVVNLRRNLPKDPS
ncbi:MAG: tRNA (adenosine(37)-N6)-threonylcarbamoyltransferase complex dimerization subunit type 1 TsaB [Thermotogae bacterium]|nr:tRNA (adenosine(37)-N6)-threonylcarbamoyltransferase complex dimerization subunit type 1 TsaB [Thermotogota bacterium]